VASAPKPTAGAWLSPGAAPALATGDLGVILRAYRRAKRLTQQQLAAELGYDPSYISMLERGRRTIRDRGTLACIARKLSIPPHILGVTDPGDTDFLAMLQFASAAIRLAEVARQCGRPAEAVSELWPLIARLEARIAGGRAEREVAILVARARTAFGISLGHVLPDERLAAAARWTGRALHMAQRLGDQPLLSHVLRMHGNELRKVGHPAAAVARLQHALRISDAAKERGATLALLARAAADAGDRTLFDDAIGQCLRLLDADGEHSMLFSAFTIREIRLRGLLVTGRATAAVTLAGSTADTASAPSPQWRIIERITAADVLVSAGDAEAAAGQLSGVVSEAEARCLPHQIQRVIHLTSRSPGLACQEISEHARAALARLRAQPAVGMNATVTRLAVSENDQSERRDHG